MVSQAARRNLEAHIEGEKRHDMRALMAPLAPEPSYVIPDFILKSRAAVQALYERSMALLSEELLDEYLRALDDPAVTRWGEDHCVIEYSDDYPRHRNMIVVVHFEDDLVKSENTYFRTSNPPLLKYDQAFLATPGVERLA